MYYILTGLQVVLYFLHFSKIPAFVLHFKIIPTFPIFRPSIKCEAINCENNYLL